MHATLQELLENLRPGLLWVNHEGKVRYANTDATQRTGLAQGRRVYEPPLLQAVAMVVKGEPPMSLQVPGLPPDFGKAAPMLDCRVLPGFSKDDAFVLIQPDPASDKTVAYGNLMQVLHSDLGDPLRTAVADLATARKQFNGAQAEHLKELFDRFSDVAHLLERVHDLAALWGNENLLDNERIELWSLLKSAWDKLEPMATHRGIEVNFRSSVRKEDLPTVYGSPTWLLKVFEDCLQSTIRAARDGARLLIEHKQVGPRAVFVFRDSGAFGAMAADAVPLPVPRDKRGMPIKRTPSGSARDFIGFELSRHIVALHGGALREDTDGGTRNFIIDLPTGAPARTEATQLDIHQAQKYAEDLSRLMARARRKTAPPPAAEAPPASADAARPADPA
jgi:hypothetical protein